MAPAWTNSPALTDAADLKPLRVADRVDPTGLGLDLAYLGQLLKRGHARLVDHEILACLHDADADRRPLAGNACVNDQLDRVVFENGFFAGCKHGLGKDAAVGLDQFRLLGVDGDQFGAGTQHEFGLAIDVPVVQADDGKSNRRVFAHFGFPVGSVEYLVLGFQCTCC